jgi:hemolysin activation/secretion protein
VTSNDTTITITYDANDSSVITNEFERLDIENQTERYRLQLRHPFYKTTTKELALSLALEREKSETSLLGEPFSFSSGVDNGVSRVTMVKLGQEWIDRSTARVYALRSTVNVGIDWLDATVNRDAPDGEFISFTLQGQSIHRLKFISGEIHTHAYLQLSNDDLLPLEKLAFGGRDTVRGYRENELTRDNGVIAGVEYQVPIGRINIPRLSQTVTDGQIKLAVFGDYGYGWNQGDNQPEPPDLASLGWGVLWFPRFGWEMEFYWGYALRRITGDDEHDLQDDGIHFAVKAKLF